MLITKGENRSRSFPEGYGLVRTRPSLTKIYLQNKLSLYIFKALPD